MYKYPKNSILSDFDANFNLLLIIETIIKLTQDYYVNKEINSVYYNLSDESKKQLSLERNNCINMLTLALNTLESAKKKNLELEDTFGNLQQNSDNSC